MLLESEIAEEYPVEDMEIFTPSGWKRVKTAYKTVPLEVWVLRTTTREIRASGHHLVRSYRQSGDTDYRCHRICTLREGDWVETEGGAEKIEEIRNTGEMEEMYDITIDSEAGLFYSNGIVSHNSTTLAARQLILSHLIPGYKSLYIVPYHDQLKTYADRYLEMEQAFRGDVGTQNKYSKTYSNGSSVAMNYALTDASRIRGRTQTEVVIDECIDNQSVTTIKDADGRDKKVRMQDVKVGDYILSFDPTSLELAYKKVTAYMPKGCRKVLELTMANGLKIKATGNHKFLTDKNSWQYLQDIRPGDNIYSLVDGKIERLSVRSVISAGETEVMDITVEGYNSFIVNGLCCHNCQNMDPNIVPEILYTMTTSKLRTTVYAGTALSIDTLLEAEWQRSSMGMWHVRAGDGRRWLNMYDKETLLAVCDHRDGPRCPYTNKLLNVTDGCYVHSYERALEAGRVGVHVPQCIIPDFANDPVQWGQIYDNIKNQDFKKVLQECFGIAVAEGSRELIEADIRRICVINESTDTLKQRCINGYYKTVVSGCDWGGSDYNPATKTKTSYTVHCIIGLAPDGFVDILHWKRYAGMDYAEVIDSIVSAHRAWNARAIASDFGVGALYNTELRNRIAENQHFIMGYVGPKAEAVAIPANAHLPNQLSVNRNEAISRVFRDVKRTDAMVIRARTWDISSGLLLDWLNMYRAIKELPSGEKSFNYIRPATKADDGLHAFTFAYVLMRMLKGENLVQDMNLQNRIRQLLGAAPLVRATSPVVRTGRPPSYVVSG